MEPHRTASSKGENPSTSNGSRTETEVITVGENDLQQGQTPVLRLTLHRATNNDKKVSWNSGTVDNEHMGKKKSKCCCVYRKPLQFGESSSESDDDECDNCSGHVERKKKNRKKYQPIDDSIDNDQPDNDAEVDK